MSPNSTWLHAALQLSNVSLTEVHKLLLSLPSVHTLKSLRSMPLTWIPAICGGLKPSGNFGVSIVQDLLRYVNVRAIIASSKVCITRALKMSWEDILQTVNDIWCMVTLWWTFSITALMQLVKLYGTCGHGYRGGSGELYGTCGHGCRGRSGELYGTCGHGCRGGRFLCLLNQLTTGTICSHTLQLLMGETKDSAISPECNFFIFKHLFFHHNHNIKVMPNL